MKESDINPYIKLLHDWKKNKNEEIRTGSFQQQYDAVGQGGAPVTSSFSCAASD